MTGAFTFGTKARTLERLAGLVTKAALLPQFSFSAEDWRSDRDDTLARIYRNPWARRGALIARSSAEEEDAPGSGSAGHYLTVGAITSRTLLSQAVDRVIASYHRRRATDDVLIQPYVDDARAAGVAAGRHPGNGSPYRVISWHPGTDTSSVTGGRGGERTWYSVSYAAAGRPPEAFLGQVLDLLTELEGIVGHAEFQLEFCVTAARRLVLLQLRPLRLPAPPVPLPAHREILTGVARRMAPRPHARSAVLGSFPLFGVMPDWNPAEMIGINPRPLAMSLYRHLLTDWAWSLARERYGYRPVGRSPVVVGLGGLPYIDVRVSLTSLLPRETGDGTARRLVDHYLQRLRAHPELHDRVEFDVVTSSYSFDIGERMDGLRRAGLGRGECDRLAASLKTLTEELVRPPSPFWTDLASLRRPIRRGSGPRRSWAGVFARLGRCRRDGTVPFAGLARAAFVAVQMLRSLEFVGAISPEDRDALFRRTRTSAGTIATDFARMPMPRFLARYGHLRPGTYDILSPRYDEAADLYFGGTSTPEEPAPPRPAETTRTLRRALETLVSRHDLAFGAAQLESFLPRAIAGRETAKFRFSRALSDALTDIAALGADLGFSRDDMSYVRIDTLRRLAQAPRSPRAVLTRHIARGRAEHAAATSVVLPPLLRDAAEVWCHEAPPTRPSYVTGRRVRARTADLARGDSPRARIVLLERADPGYDWVFAHGIVGIVTCYGGVNSHIAVRAQELGIPAVLGVGAERFGQLRAFSSIEIDAPNMIVRSAG